MIWISDYFFEKYYDRIMNAISHKPKYKKAIKVMDLTLPLMVGSSYALAVLNAHRHYGRESLMYMVGIPAVAFSSVVVARKFINQKRPYEKYNYKPLVNRKKKGNSMPSLHTFSAALIAASVSYYYPVAGMLLWVAACLIAITRVMTGVHHFRDVFVALLLGVLMKFTAFVREFDD